MSHRVVVLGTGSIGNRHTQIFSNLIGKANVIQFPAGVRDNTPPDIIASKVVMIQPSIVIIATPAHLHIPFLVLFANQHFRVLVEKPLFIGNQDAKALSELLSYYDERILVGYNLHYSPEFKYLECAQSSIGNILWAEFRCGQSLTEWRKNRDIYSTVSLKKEWGGGGFI